MASKTRAKLRQNVRRYSAAGPLRVEVARDIPGGLTMLEELAGLHQRTWQARGHPGVFASARFMEFHRTLIRKALPLDRVQLLCAAAGDQTIGLLYNFALHGKVYFYQCGFNYRHPRLSPGLITQALAIQHCLAEGRKEYDLLAGDSPHKRSLSTTSRQILWVVFRWPSVRNRVLGLLRKLKRHSQAWQKP